MSNWGLLILDDFADVFAQLLQGFLLFRSGFKFLNFLCNLLLGFFSINGGLLGVGGILARLSCSSAFCICLAAGPRIRQLPAASVASCWVFWFPPSPLLVPGLFLKPCVSPLSFRGLRPFARPVPACWRPRLSPLLQFFGLLRIILGIRSSLFGLLGGFLKLFSSLFEFGLKIGVTLFSAFLDLGQALAISSRPWRRSQRRPHLFGAFPNTCSTWLAICSASTSFLGQLGAAQPPCSSGAGSGFVRPSRFSPEWPALPF